MTEEEMFQAALEKFRDDHGRAPSPDTEAVLRYFCRLLLNSLAEDDEQ
jgi:hypothetical protein